MPAPLEPFDYLLASWRVESPEANRRGDIDRWAAKLLSAPSYWPNIALRALRWQRQGLDAAALAQLVRDAAADYEARIAAIVARAGVPRGRQAAAKGSAANAELTAKLLEEL